MDDTIGDTGDAGNLSESRTKFQKGTDDIVSQFLIERLHIKGLTSVENRVMVNEVLADSLIANGHARLLVDVENRHIIGERCIDKFAKI